METDNLTHLRDRRDALIARGITPEGYAHLTEYCKHLDSLLAKRRREIPDEIPTEPMPTDAASGRENASSLPAAGGGTELRTVLAQQRRENEKIERELDSLGSEIGDSTRVLCDKMERMREKIRLLILLASVGAVGGVLAFLVALIVLIR